MKEAIMRLESLFDLNGDQAKAGNDCDVTGHLKLKTLVGPVLATFAFIGGANEADATVVTWAENNHRYEIFVVDTTWIGAFASAISMGPKSNLVSITSAAENIFVQNLLLTTSANSAWIGGIQSPFAPAPDEGWNWTDGERFGFTNWAAGEPNDIVPGGEFFLEMGRFGQWNDVGPINAVRRAFIVETVPLPASLSLMLAGLGGLGWMARRKTRAS